MAGVAAVISPLGARVKLGNEFCAGTAALRASNAKSGGVGTAAPAEHLQVRASKKLLGKVVTSSNDKTVTVEVSRIAPHSKYQKRVKSAKNYVVHDPENLCKIGDIVTLTKCAPVSKRKSFVVLQVRTGKGLDSGLSEEELSLPPFESALSA